MIDVASLRAIITHGILLRAERSLKPDEKLKIDVTYDAQKNTGLPVNAKLVAQEILHQLNYIRASESTNPLYGVLANEVPSTGGAVEDDLQYTSHPRDTSALGLPLPWINEQGLATVCMTYQRCESSVQIDEIDPRSHSLAVTPPEKSYFSTGSAGMIALIVLLLATSLLMVWFA